MRGPCRHRLVSADQLVPALCTSLHTLQPMRQREIDRLILAQLKMQERHVLSAAPVAAV